MSDKGIYTALSGAMAQSQRLDTIANNIANSSTPAFKRDSQVFKEYLTAYEKVPNVIQVPKVPASIESFYDTQGGDKSYVDSAGTFTDFTQGVLKLTGNPLDLGLEGNGFFEVMTPSGVRYTRSGSLKIDSEGRLVTKEGHPVLRAGDRGGDANSRIIRLTSSKLNVTGSGDLFSDGESLGKISIVNVEPRDGLQKVGSSLFKLRENFNPQITENSTAQIHQGSIEASNVDIVKEMTDMINTTRTFESSQRAIKAYDELAQKLVNVVPRLE